MSADAPLRLNDAVVSALAHAVNEGGASLAHVPGLVKRAIRENCWQERAVQALHGEIASFASFEQFITSAPPRGLGTDERTLKRLCALDHSAIDAIDEAAQKASPLGTNQHSEGFDNIKTLPPVGTSAQYAIRRLRKDRPDLHARVLAGELSPHAAAIEAGFRVRTIAVPLDPARAARILARYFDPAELAARLLAVA